MSVATANECLLCGIPHKRHTFAVNNLRFWFAHGEDVGGLLPVLQTYLVIPRSPTPATTFI